MTSLNFIRALNKHKIIDIAIFFFIECLIRVLFLDLAKKLNQKNGIAFHRIPFFKDHRPE